MKSNLCAFIALSFLLMVPFVQARAQACASGLYRAGCAGANGAVVVNKPPAPYAYRPATPYYSAATPYYHASGTVHCANGVYRAGCAGPRGAAVVRKPY
jgi:hypothetical protein